MTLESIIKALSAIQQLSTAAIDAKNSLDDLGITTKGGYGFIHKEAFINYRGMSGRLVWDYILLNELTFEDSATGNQYRLGLSHSDKTTEKFFNDLVERYGV